MTEPTLFKLRVRYVKRGRLRYLGHLEVAHTIERVVRRAGLPYAVTQGFSPHMRVAFSAALPVGTYSESEWYDLVLTEYVPAPEALARLVAATPADLVPLEGAYVDIRAKALTAHLTRAVYRIDMTPAKGLAISPGDIEDALGRISERGSIEYLRGKKTKRLDVARTLTAFSVERVASGAFQITLDTHQDNDGSMRPEILLGALDAMLAAHYLPDVELPLLETGIASFACFSVAAIVRVEQSCEDERA